MAEEISFSRPPKLPGVELLSVKNNRRCWRWFHETYSICTLLRIGGTRWTYRGRIHEAGQGGLMMLEPGEVHNTLKTWGSPSNDSNDFLVSFIAPSLIRKAAEEMGLSPELHMRFPEMSSPKVFQAFVGMHEAMKREATLLEQQSRLASCLRLLLGPLSEKGFLPEPSPPHPRALQRVRDYIISHFAEKIELNDLSVVAGISRFYLVRAFKNVFGLTPHAFQIQVRVERARVLILQGNPLPVMEAGFSDQSHLIRHFKRILGVTPGHYARSR